MMANESGVSQLGTLLLFRFACYLLSCLTPKGSLRYQYHVPVCSCHAWDDRAGAAKELYDQLQSRGVSVWFSEVDVRLGTQLLREIDKGLAKSRVGIVLVTPALLLRLQGESIADKELSVLLARDQLVPIVHGTTYEALRDVSPMLASRSGLSTVENPMTVVASKLAELVAA